MHSFTFNGHSSDEFGIRIERFPDLNRSAMKFQTDSVSGRNGNIYQFENAWEEVTVSYQIFAGERQEGAAVSDFTEIVEWLNSADDYAVLTDTYDPTHYRLAVFVDELEIESQWHTFGKATVRFRCRPQRFIVETSETLTNPMTINNPTNHNAYPILELDGSGYANLVRIDGRTNVLGIEDYAGAGFFTRLPAGCETEGYCGCRITPNGNMIPNTASNTGTGTYNAGQVVYLAVANYGIGLPMAVLPQTEYSLSFKTSKTGSTDAVLSTVYFFDSFGNYISRYLTKSTTYSADVKTTFNFTTPVECGFIMLVVSGATNATTYTIKEIMLNYGLTAITYSAYASFTATVKINDITMQINQKFNKAVIDCENETLTIEGQRANPASVLLDKDGFPSAEYLHLKSGNNSYSSTNVSSGTITKRFWEL